MPWNLVLVLEIYQERMLGFVCDRYGYVSLTVYHMMYNENIRRKNQAYESGVGALFLDIGHFRTGISNPKVIEGHMPGKNCSVVRRLREKCTFWILKVKRATETLLMSLLRPAGRVFETWFRTALSNPFATRHIWGMAIFEQLELFPNNSKLLCFEVN